MTPFFACWTWPFDWKCLSYHIWQTWKRSAGSTPRLIILDQQEIPFILALLVRIQNYLQIWIFSAKKYDFIRSGPEAEFLDEILTKPDLPWDFYFFKLPQPLTVATVQLLYTVEEKGGKPDRIPYPLPFGLRKQYRNFKSENSQDYAQKPQRNGMFMNSASGLCLSSTGLIFFYS